MNRRNLRPGCCPPPKSKEEKRIDDLEKRLAEVEGRCRNQTAILNNILIRLKKAGVE